MQSAETIAVLGAGRWGITLAHVAARNGAEVRLWAQDGRRAAHLQRSRRLTKLVPELDALAEAVSVTADVEQACAAATTLVLACPAAAVRGLVAGIGNHLGGHHQVVSAVRGMDGASLAFPSQIVRGETCVRQVGALLGPMVIEDLLLSRPNAAVVASRFPSVRQTMQEVFASDCLRVYSSDDLVGVEVAAAGAGVGALAVGVCLQLELGAATLAAFITRATAELSRVVAAAGGKPESAFGLAGLGDLIARREAESREVQAGRLLAQGHSRAEIQARLGHLEAIEVATSFAELAQKRGIDVYLASAVAGMLSGERTAAQALNELMNLGQMADA